ncbi:Crp/Fnr family transcriptional regulator [Rhodopseudomonas palustris]|uniref:Crp/Fnr family transcriptional regulator n=1 Tax=Rhodopseudomonas palustris TaxID=1076 RepID=A0A323UG57_RHOPL|nr:Crp/Fnr family transcriptional regulator [Rhodopseudomonas palustris]PZA11349.1 Crp/Fnr family transcriptional regulator [Rhodopseudomonas palustris]
MDKGAFHAAATRSGLFSQLPPAEASRLLDASSLRQFPVGQALFHQGDTPEYLYQIVSGLVRITQINSAGEQITLRIMRPGDLCCVAAFRQRSYPATATAIKATATLAWRTNSFIALTQQSPAIADNVVCIAGDRTREMLQRATEMTGKCIAQRIAASLLRLSAQAGTANADGIHIESPVTRIDLASMAGLTYFTVSRTLSAWQKQGLVKSGRHRLTILDMPRLAEIAEPRVGAL